MGWAASRPKYGVCHLASHFRPVFGTVAGLVVRPEVRPARGSQTFCFGSPPGSDFGVVAGEQHIWDWLAFEHRRSGVLRIFKEPVGKALLGARGFLAHDTRQQSHTGIKHGESCRLSAGEHEVTERDLLKMTGLYQPLVDPFEPCAHHDYAEASGKLRHARLRQPRAARTHQQARAGVMRHGIESAGKNIGLHHHAGAAAGRCVVDGAIFVGGMRANVVDIELPDTVREPLASEAQRQRPGKHLREDRQYARAPHAQSSSRALVSIGGTTPMHPASMSIVGPVGSVNGNTRAAPPATRSISTISPAPKLWIVITLPSVTPSLLTAARPTRSAW